MLSHFPICFHYETINLIAFCYYIILAQGTLIKAVSQVSRVDIQGALSPFRLPPVAVHSNTSSTDRLQQQINDPTRSPRIAPNLSDVQWEPP